MEGRMQTKTEEILNAITHAAGIIFCLAAMPFLLINAYQKHAMPVFWGVFAFGAGMLMVYTSSTLYHAVQHRRAKNFLQRVDHMSIYFLIAGTYTPLVIRYLPKTTAIIFLSVMWVLVGVGVVFKLFFTNRFHLVSLLIYLVMGWMIVFIIKPAWDHIPLSIIGWIIAGGLSYTAGVYFFIRSRINYFHAIWHCFVLGGTIAHYVCVYKSI
jgi:hemolysin III